MLALGDTVRADQGSNRRVFLGTVGRLLALPVLQSSAVSKTLGQQWGHPVRRIQCEKRREGRQGDPPPSIRRRAKTLQDRSFASIPPRCHHTAQMSAAIISLCSSPPSDDGKLPAQLPAQTLASLPARASETKGWNMAACLTAFDEQDTPTSCSVYSPGCCRLSCYSLLVIE